jgi:hypothetical protein
MISGFLDYDASAVLDATETLVRDRGELDVDDVRLIQHWADLHSTAPEGPRVPGGDHLSTYGGEGTPTVRELCWAELAIARGTSVVAMQRLAADALDLRHRIPLVWQAVQELRLPVWVARRVATLSRDLSKDAVVIVDVAVAAAADQAPGRVLRIAEAKVIEADPDAHRARLAKDAAQVGVTLARPKPGDAVSPVDGEPATGRVTLKLPRGAALDFDAAVAEVADALHDQLPETERDTVTRGELQVKAVELLSNPHAAAAFLDTVGNTDDPTGDQPGPLPKPKKRPATLYVFLTDLVLGGRVDGVARAEGIGPVLLEQVVELLEHRQVTVQPVIDLNHTHAVNGYEHPTAAKHRTLLRMLGDAFPHSANIGYRRLDHDHPAPYVPPDRGGPPGQTGDHADAPLSRTHHRVKTHVPGYRVDQLALGTYRWVTPHGLARMVTRHGTTKIQLIHGPDHQIVGEIYPGPRIHYHPRN